MATRLVLEAILPKRPELYQRATVERALSGLLRVVAMEAQRELQVYPPWMPWKNPPKTGPRAGGRRTGAYGRGWAASGIIDSGIMGGVEIVNYVPYARWLAGPGQARHMGARGWRTSRAVGESVITRLAAQGLISLSYLLLADSRGVAPAPFITSVANSAAARASSSAAPPDFWAPPDF